VALLDQRVGIDQLEGQLGGEEPSDGGLAGAHEPGEHDVAAGHGNDATASRGSRA
jgi:hypothetical protein